MNENPEQEEFIKLVIKYHDDQLTDEEWKKLKNCLSTSDDYVKQFNDFGLLTTQLIQDSEKISIPQDRIKIVEHEKNTLSKILAIAAFVAISLFSLSTLVSVYEKGSQGDSKSYSAKISYVSSDLSWEMGEDLIVDENNAEDGWFNISKGKTILVFKSGAEMEIEGPALFAVVSPMEAYLEYGKVSVYAPESARNFTVKVPTMDIVDLGTKFSIDIDPKDGESKVNVTEGLVDLHLKVSDEKEALYAGAEAKVNPKGELVTLTNPRKVPELYAHWDFNQIEQDQVQSSYENVTGKLIGSQANLLTQGRDLKAYDFSEEQYLDLAANLEGMPRDNFTISTWVKNPTNMIFSMSNGTKYKRIQFERFKNRLLYGWQNGKFFDSVNAIVDWKEDHWHHVAFSINEGRVSLFMDGKKLVDHEDHGRLNSRVISAKNIEEVTHIYIGRLFKGTPSKDFPDRIQKLRGQIDDFQIYHSTLSEQEIEYLYLNPGKTLNLNI